MNRKVIFAILSAFCFVIALIFFLFYLNSPKKEETKVKKYKSGEEFLCKSGVIYNFQSNNIIQKIFVKNGTGTLSTSEAERLKINGFFIQFDQDTTIGIEVINSGFFVSTEQTTLNFPVLLFLKTDKYSAFTTNVVKGNVLDAGARNELYFMGQFKDNVLTDETLIKNNRKGTIFYDDYTLKFKAAEVPMLLLLNKKPYSRDLEISYGTSHHGYGFIMEPYTKYDKEIVLKKGEILRTDFWLEHGDEVTFNSFGCSDGGLDLSLDGENWGNINCGTYQYRKTFYDKTGYLHLRAKGDVFINKIAIRHDKMWKLNLVINEIEKISVFKNDILLLFSNSRFYINGQIVEANKVHEYRSTEDGSFEVKGSVEKNEILVFVSSRRGY